ncbi:hypothetical protein LY78DRAFT_433768 [Colletotrichum sublineola]|nr:hypothetical protein LY78DRAFT_433768 [Colletotrichum sublineola]
MAAVYLKGHSCEASLTVSSTLNQLCQLKANWLPETNFTYRATRVPIGYDEDQLKRWLKDNTFRTTGVQVIHVESMVTTSKDEVCATFSAPVKIMENSQPQHTTDCDISVDSTFEGITPLYDAKRKAKADIIAVPGLGTNAIWTFRPPSQNSIWLRDFLPKDIPNCRIMLCGYDSQVQQSNSGALAKDYALSMLRSIVDIREKTKTTNRPIIFIGHSLGGIIIQWILLKASESGALPNHKRLFDHCKGIMFFGVPNKGLNNPPLEVMTQDQPNHDLILSILKEENGDTPGHLLKLNTEFVSKVKPRKSIQKCCYYEQRKSPTPVKNEEGKWERKGEKTMMVDENSAEIPNLKCDVEPLNRNHSDLTKFTGYDQDYITVMQRLRGWV